MLYNEQKLESFSRRAFKYEEQKIIDTHHAIRDAIVLCYDKKAVEEKYGFSPDLEVYLQGSYKNSTNVTQTSDVDVVVQLKTLWRDNREVLSADQRAKYEALHSSVSYPFEAFNFAIMNAMQQYFGAGNVTNDNKCLKIKEHGKYGNADIVPCFTYRYYGYFESVEQQKFREGIYFFTNDGTFVRNFPKLHYEALTQKSEATNGIFKETVRMFKNMRDDLTDKGWLYSGVAKSYFIENLLYNLPNSCFTRTRMEAFKQVLALLNMMLGANLIRNFKCANGIDGLFGERHWSYYDAEHFFEALNRAQRTT